MANPRRLTRSTRVLQVAKKVQLSSAPLEEDFHLETSADTRGFLSGTDSFMTSLPQGPLSSSRPHTSYVGPPGLFEKFETNPPTQQLPSTRRDTKRTLRRITQELPADPQAAFQAQLTEIADRLKSAVPSEASGGLRPDQRILLTRDAKSLAHFAKVSRNWENIAGNLSSATRRSPSKLLLNSGPEWRDRIEAIEYIDRNSG